MKTISLPIYDLSGKTTSTIELDATIFNVEPNVTLLHQAVTTHLANKRAATASTKDRSEVRGGGRKPWRQKGTGNARAGSSRSPIWRGGGITFGPNSDRNYSKRMPQKMRQAALKMALSSKATDKSLVIISGLESLDGKTKSWINAFKLIPHTHEKALIVAVEKADTVDRSIRNLPTQKFVGLEGLTTYDVIRFPQLVMSQEAVEGLAKRFGPEAQIEAKNEAKPVTKKATA